MKDVQFKILCPSEMKYSELCELAAEFDIDKLNIHTIHVLAQIYEFWHLTAWQSSKIIQVFSDNGYAVWAVEMKETKHAS